MAVTRATSVANSDAIAVASSTNTITLTPLSTGAGDTNRVTIVRVFTFSRLAAGVGVPISMTFSGGTLSAVVSRPFNSTVAHTVWACVNTSVVTNQSIVITLDKSVEKIIAYACTYKGCYITANPSFYYEDSSPISTGLISTSDPDADNAGALVEIASTFRSGLTGTPTITALNGQVALGSSTSNTTVGGLGITVDGIVAANFTNLIGPVAPQTDSYTVLNSSVAYSQLLVVEIKPLGWVPVTPTPPACAYFKGGYVRKMVNNVTGLTHLEGQTVLVVTDGIIPSPAEYEVTGGTLVPALTNKAAVVHVGLPYVGKIKFLPLGGDGGQNVNETKERKVYDICMRVFNSLGGKFGKDEDHVFPIDFPPTDEVLFTGDIHDIPFESSWDELWQPVFIQDSPLPFMVLAFVIRSEISEDK